MPKIPFREAKIGVISDLHNDLDVLDESILFFKDNPVDAIVLNGDIPGYTVSSYTKIINRLLKLGTRIIIFPGSHENGELYAKAMSKFSSNRLVIDAHKVPNRLLQYGLWELVSLPGSGVVSNGPRKFTGGSFWLLKDKPSRKRLKEMNAKIKSLGFARFATPVSISDVQSLLDKKSLTAGAKKVLFAHDPIVCKTKNGIDIAKFGKAKKDFTVKKIHAKTKKFSDLSRDNRIITTKNILPLSEAKLLKKFKYPIVIKRKHVGDEIINHFLKKNRITKFVCGHIHECGKQAIDKNENKVKPHSPTSQLFLNSGPGTACILSFPKAKTTNKISYEFM